MTPAASQFELVSVIIAAQGGSVTAARQLVERYQGDLLGIAYLLTGERAAAFGLAGNVCERALAQLGGFDPEDDVYPWLLRHIPAALLATETRRPDGTPGAAPAVVSGAERHHVDDDRSRMRGALDLLSPRERLQAVLTAYAGLSESDAASIAMILPGENAEPRPGAEVRRRLRGLASLDADQSLANALRRVAVEAPRASIWDEIEAAVEGRFARQRLRGRLSSLGAIAAVLVLLGGVGLLLLYGALGSDNPSPSGAGASVPVTPTAPRPTARAEATTATAPFSPPGDVPDLLLYELAVAGSTWGVSDPSSDVGGRRLPEGELEGISPDGGTLLLIHQEWRADRVDMTLVAASSATGEELWRSDVRPLAEGGPNSVYFDLIAIDDLIYVASHDRSYRENVLTIAVIRLADGTLRDIWGLNVGVEFSGPGLAVDLYGTLKPDPPELTVHIQSFEHGWEKIHRIDLRSGVTRFDSEPVSGLGPLPGRRLLAPDGQGIVVIPPDGLSDDPAVSYLDFETMTGGRIELPFAPVDALDGIVVEYALSHDGRRLFALDIYNRQIAIVDLTLRQVQQVVKLQDGTAAGEYAPALYLQTAPAERLGSQALLSPDGRYLYAVGPPLELPGDPYPPGLGVWKIDISSWTLEAQWLLGGRSPIASIHGDSSGDFLYVHRSGPAAPESGENSHLTVIARTTDGEVVATPFSLDVPVSGAVADFYRWRHGRSPAVAGVVASDNRELMTRPVLDVQIDPRSGPVVTTVDVRARLLDPATGELLTDAARPDLRSPAPGFIVATFENGAERRAAILTRSVEGDYHGRFELDLPGPWTLTLSAGEPAVDGWSLTRPSVVQLVDATTGPDGRDYVFELVSFPGAPSAGRQVELTVRFVPALGISATGVDDELGPLLPSSLDLLLPDGSTVILYNSGFLSYSGLVTFPTPGVIFPTVTYTVRGGQPVTLTVRIEVGAGP